MIVQWETNEEAQIRQIREGIKRWSSIYGLWPGYPTGHEAYCANCGAEAEMRCVGCRRTHYCNRQCQKNHWRQHKKTCQRIKIAVRGLGGEKLIIEEVPKGAELAEVKDRVRQWMHSRILASGGESSLEKLHIDILRHDEILSCRRQTVEEALIADGEEVLAIATLTDFPVLRQYETIRGGRVWTNVMEFGTTG